MRNKYKGLLLGLLLGTGLSLGLTGCNNTANAEEEQNYPLTIWHQNENGSMDTYNIVDQDTGVNYVVVSKTDYASGRPATSVSVCPRYNADGSLYVSK